MRRRSLHELPDVVKFNRQLLPHVRALLPEAEVRTGSEAARCAEQYPATFAHLLCCAAHFYVHEQRDKRQDILGSSKAASTSRSRCASLEYAVSVLETYAADVSGVEPLSQVPWSRCKRSKCL